ncbi:MAG: hypothetical protein ACYC09_15180 [Bacteroidota bacterium]
MTTLSEAYKVWLKRYPSWKMERAIRHGSERLGFVLLDSISQKRKVFLFARCEFETSIHPKDQSVTIPQIVVDGLSMKAGRPDMIIAVRGRFFQVDPRAVVDHHFTKRETLRDVNMYRFTLSHVGAWDITESMTRLEQGTLFDPKTISAPTENQ